VGQIKNIKNAVGLNMDNTNNVNNKNLRIQSIIKKFFSPCKDYLRSLLPYILISALIFLLGIISGYYFAEVYPSESGELLSLLEKTYKPILEMNKVSQVLFIFLKNGVTSFLIIIFGVVFGFLSIVSLISNGEILGMLANFTLEKSSIFYFLLGILPHGVIEIPCFLISSAIGLKIGRTLIKKIFGKGGSLKEELNLGLNTFLRIILVFLFLAAIIEVLISSELLRIY